jgi:hypothetical protein
MFTVMPYAATVIAPSSLRGEGTDLTIITALMALLADRVMGLVASTHRNYLAEFNDYLDDRGLKQRPSRRTPA